MTGVSLGAPLGRLPAEVRGREGLLRRLRGQLSRGGLVVLAGMGGVGKSTVAAELARRVRAPRLLRRPLARRVWWVSGATATSLTAGMVSVARGLGAGRLDLEAIDAQAADAPDRLWALLEGAPRGWLLVVDNADDPHLLAAPALPGGGESGPVAQVADGTGWVRPTGRGVVLVSSRHGGHETWGKQAVVHRLWPLSDREAGRVLCDLAPGAGGHTEAEALGRRLGGLPLALHLAGLNVGAEYTRWATFDAYREALDRDPVPVQLLSADSDLELAHDQRAVVMRTWELSLDALAEQGLPQARALLRLLSCYAPALPIPLELLRREALSRLLRASEETAAEDGRGSDEVLRALARLGLVEGGEDRMAVVVHPVVADTNRAHLRAATIPPDPDPQVVRQTALALVVSVVGELDQARPADWPRYGRLTPHVLALLQTTGAHLTEEHLGDLLGVASAVANAYDCAGAPASAMTVTSAALALSRRLGDDHPAILRMRYDLACEIGQQGRWREAESAFREVLAAGQRVLGADHPDTLATRHDLVRAVASQGRWKEAESAFHDVLAARRRVLGADHPDTLATRHRIAWTVAEQGRWREAERAFRDVLAAEQRVLGADHPDTLATRHSIAWAVAEQGRWSEAEDAFREVLAARRRVLGADHPHTLTSRHNIAGAVASQGRWKEAEGAFREVLAARRRVLGADHPHTLTSRHGLAWAVAEQGRWREAEGAFREVLAARRRVLGADHPDTLSTRHRAAWAVAGQRRWSEAESAFREVLAARRRVLGADHPDTLTTHHDIARTVAEQGRWEEAESAYREVQAARQRVLGADHPDALTTGRALHDLVRRRPRGRAPGSDLDSGQGEP